MKFIQLRVPFALILCGFLGVICTAQIPERTFMMDPTGFQIRVLKNGIFGLGERFVYDVNYGIITAGEAGLEILPDPVIHRDAPCYDIHSWARSSAAFSIFFKVRDEIHSYMDTRGIFTWYFEKHLNEGSYHDVKVVDYDQRIGKAYMEDDGVPKDTSNIPLFVQDALTALYYFRLLPDIQVGRSYFVPVHDIRKTYPLRVDVLARETIKVPLGKFDCYKVEPVLESAGIFKQKGRIFLWFTADELRLPVLMQSKVLIGHISAMMREYRPGTPLEP